MSSRNLTLQRRIELVPLERPFLFLSRETTEESFRERWFTEKDLFLLLLQGTLGVSALTLPRRWWPRVCAVTSLPRLALKRRKQLAGFAQKAAEVLDGGMPADFGTLFAATHRRLHERQMIYLQERLSAHGVVTEVAGMEHLRASLARGSGAILWNTPALADTIVTKRALASVGVRAHQLSVRSHGFSQSRFAVKHLNPGQIAVEDRYLGGRIWFDGADTVRATREAVRRLKANECVLFTNSLFAGRSFVAVPLANTLFLTLPTTPLSIAAKMAVPLHVVTTVEVEPFARYVCHISADLRPDARDLIPGDDAEQVARLAQRVRDVLLDRLRAHPDQIRLWDRLMTSDAFGSADDPRAEAQEIARDSSS